VLIDFSSCDIVISGQGHVKVPLIISQIEINLAAVIQNVNFAYENEHSPKSS